MRTKLFIITFLNILSQQVFSQSYPTFGPEIKVTITGLTFDAMEPFISTDGNTLFFNSLNSGGNTNLYYATKVNDSTFNFIGLVGGCYDSSLNHLDAVASIDSLNNFYWTSLRSIPNFYRGDYLAGNVSNISKVYGDVNMPTPGWIIMDAAIDYSGDFLYYCNGYFGPTFTECLGAPCEAKIGVAQKVNDSVFNKTSNSDALFSNINDTAYIVYAPQLTKDRLELYYTRLLHSGFNTEICVSVRNSLTESFSIPMVIYSNYGFFPEAASPTTDKQKIYYHQKDSSFTYTIYLRYKTGTTSAIYENSKLENLKIYPNPSTSIFTIDLPKPKDDFEITIYSLLGKEVYRTSDITTLDLSVFPNGVYLVKLKQAENSWINKIIKE